MFFYTGPPPKSSKYTKVNLEARLGVFRTIYVNVDSPNPGFLYFNFFGEAQCKKNTLYLLDSVFGFCFARCLLVLHGSLAKQLEGLPTSQITIEIDKVRN